MMRQPRPFPALGLAPSVEQQLEARLAPFVTARAISRLSCLTVGMIARRCGITDLDVLLAFALAFAATEHGHTGYELGGTVPHWLQHAVETQEQSGTNPEDVQAPNLVTLLPADGAAWQALVCAQDCVALGDQEPTPQTLFVFHEGLLSIHRMASAELRVAGMLQTLAAQQAQDVPLDEAQRRWLVGLLPAMFNDDGSRTAHPADGVDRQRLAALAALERHLTVVTGGPGMGKTWSIRAMLLSLAWARHLQGKELPRIALAAPTGKAAARMREAIQDKLDEVLDSIEASIAKTPAPGGVTAERKRMADFLGKLEEFTLHRLLGLRGSSFEHDASNPLPYDVVVVDEASMADLNLVSALLDAIDPATTRLVLVGDRNQLASVDAGTVLADVCGPAAAKSEELAQPLIALAQRWGLPGQETPAQLPARPLAHVVVPFRKFHRFDETSGIGVLARGVIQQAPEAWQYEQALLELKQRATIPDGDFQLVTRVGQDGAPRSAGELRELAIDAAVTAYAEAFRPLADSTLDANAGQQLDQASEETWLALQKRFDLFRLLSSHRAGEDGVRALNREIMRRLLPLLRKDVKLGKNEKLSKVPDNWQGKPLLVTRNDYQLGLYNGDIGFVLRVRLHDEEKARLRAVFRIQRGDKTYWRILQPERLVHVEPALAMTIHKCQGSQFTTVALLLPREHSPLLTRELVYTGLTRARAKAILYADEHVLYESLKARVERASRLRQRLWG